MPGADGLLQAGAHGVQAVNERPVPGRRLAPGLDTQRRRRECSSRASTSLRAGSRPAGSRPAGSATAFAALRKPVATRVPLVDGALRAIAAPQAESSGPTSMPWFAASTSFRARQASDMVIPRSPSPA